MRLRAARRVPTYHLAVVGGLRRSWRIEYIAGTRRVAALFNTRRAASFISASFYPWNQKRKRQGSNKHG